MGLACALNGHTTRPRTRHEKRRRQWGSDGGRTCPPLGGQCLRLPPPMVGTSVEAASHRLPPPPPTAKRSILRPNESTPTRFARSNLSHRNDPSNEPATTGTILREMENCPPPRNAAGNQTNTNYTNGSIARSIPLPLAKIGSPLNESPIHPYRLHHRQRSCP